MRPLSEKTQKILSFFDEGKDNNEIFVLMNGSITKQGISNAISRYRNGNGKPKEAMKPIDNINKFMRNELDIKEPGNFYTNSEEAIEESLDSLDYDIIKKTCNRVIKQLRNKMTGDPLSSTDGAVHDAEYIKEKLLRMGLIR